MIRTALIILMLLFCISIAYASAGIDEAVEKYKKGDYKPAYKEFKALAEKGNAKAQYNLGIMYYSGKGVPRDPQEALKWFKLSASQGHPDAQYNLGVLYYSGIVVPKDHKEALKWFNLSAEQGESDAQYYLGVMYDKGEGVPKDYVKAYMWFQILTSKKYTSAKENRDTIAEMMTSSQIRKAQNLAREWLDKHKSCSE